MAKIEIYLINTCDPKGVKIRKQTAKDGVQFNFVPPEGVKIRKQAAKDGVQFNFVPPEGVPSSSTPLRNIGESMAVGLERIDQISPKSYTLFKPSEGLSPIGVKKDSLNLPACNSEGQELVSFCPMLFL